MKKISQLLVLLGAIVLVACTTESPTEYPTGPEMEPPTPGGPGNPTGVDGDQNTNIFFLFLDGDGSSNQYIDMPPESSASDLLVGRWSITKIGVDEINNGNIINYHYQNYDHKDCGTSFLQFNSDGLVFENSYHKADGTCTLYTEIDEWEMIGENRFKIYVYDNIYLVKLTPSELILKYDWNFMNSLYAPMQVYYHYKRV